MRNGRRKIDISYLVLAIGALVAVVAASLFLFPDWRESPVQILVLFVLAAVGVVSFFASFRSAFMPDQKDDSPPAKLDYDSPQHRRNQENVTATIRATYIDGVLRDSLPERVRLELALDSPVGVLRRTEIRAEGREPRRSLASAADIADLFRAGGRALLILGAPGSGKSITLLELCRPILEGAEADPRRPVPVVLNLSTWAQARAPLEEWIAEEMLRQYGLNKQVTPLWLAADHLILLLDGLDEVAPDARDACVRAINAFRESHGAGMAVCSRSADYDELSERLALSRAVEILPLTPAQIDAYLSDERLNLDAVRQAIARDDALRELATTPLMLNVMAVAYGDRPYEDLLPLLVSPTERRSHLYDAYLDRMFRRRPLDGMSYDVAQALEWLRFLARQLTARDETQFFIEDLQPDWLPDRRGRWVGVLGGMLVGVLFGVLFGLLFGGLGGLLLGGPGGFLLRVLGGVLFGVLAGVLFGKQSSIGNIEPVDELAMDLSLHAIGRAIKASLRLGVLLGVSFSVFGGLLGNVLGKVLYGVLFGMLYGVLFGVLYGALLDLMRGLQSNRRNRPNEGIRRAAKNALRGGVLFGVLLGVLFGILFGVLFGVLEGMLGDLLLRVLGSVLFGGLVGGLRYGGAAVIKHYVLRLLLYLYHLLPLRLIPFLEAMRERILVQRAGAHYRFIHRTFQEHVAALTDERIGALGQTSEVFRDL